MLRGVRSIVSAKSRWRSSERIALRVLENLGYKIIDIHRKVVVKGIEVAEVDAIAEDNDGVKYAVEVKAGRLDVSGVRQAYTNAKLLSMKPLVVCKGFVDDAAKVAAEELNVKVIELSDQFLVDAEELEVIVRESVENVLDEYLESILTPFPEISKEEIKTLKAIAENPTITEAAKALNIDLLDLLNKINKLKRKGILPKTRSYGEIRRRSKILLYKFMFENRLNSVLERLEKITTAFGESKKT
ncbi:MAG: recombinase RecB [Thermoprotei archaeon]|nr:MAG: recombinase RecB [Thermoprotei archaeon]